MTFVKGTERGNVLLVVVVSKRGFLPTFEVDNMAVGHTVARKNKGQSLVPAFAFVSSRTRPYYLDAPGDTAFELVQLFCTMVEAYWGSR